MTDEQHWSSVGDGRPVEMTRQQIDDELTHASLEWLAENGDDDVLRDMARDVLAGNITLTGAARSMAYGERMAALMSQVSENPEILSDEWMARYAADVADFEQNLADRHNITVRD
ncbi:hypothetical protein AAH979_39535 [Plantactinospora sp. ZYX-F-223]|uniref:hypothetical protein n=1 Tax=Plantactinospora sp. ZYX-F-223 TaxID=3144103 RepID=UPI0031FC03A3